jgi:Toprim domain
VLAVTTGSLKSAAHIARSLGGTPSAGGFVCRCPLPSHGAGRGDRNPSLSIRDGENGLLLVRCHAGCDTSEVIAEFRRRGLLLIGSQPTHSTNLNAQRDVNSGRPPQGVAGGTDDRERIRSAREIWAETRSPRGTLAWTSLARRGIDLDELPEGIEQVLRFHPACPFGGGGKRLPCLVALYRDIVTNEPKAVHRTALAATGEKIDRKALGPKAGCAIKLSADENVSQSLTIGEGVETTLAGMALGFRPAWALGDANEVARFSVLSGIESLTILVDNDRSGTGQAAAIECSRRWTKAGREVFRVVPNLPDTDMADLIRDGDDTNDVVQRTGT